MSEKQIEESDKSIWVSNISPKTTEGELKHFFSKFGEIELAEIPEGKRFGRRQYAFIHFTNRSSAEKAINEANGAYLNDYSLIVKKAFKPQYDIESYRRQKEEESKGGNSSIPPRRREFLDENYPRADRYERRLPPGYEYRPMYNEYLMRRSAYFDDYRRQPPPDYLDDIRGPRFLGHRRLDPHLDPYYDDFRPRTRDPYYDRPFRELPPYEPRPPHDYRGSRFPPPDC